jgi:hypothetical protein
VDSASEGVSLYVGIKYREYLMMFLEYLSLLGKIGCVDSHEFDYRAYRVGRCSIFNVLTCPPFP